MAVGMSPDFVDLRSGPYVFQAHHFRHVARVRPCELRFDAGPECFALLPRALLQVCAQCRSKLCFLTWVVATQAMPKTGNPQVVDGGARHGREKIVQANVPNWQTRQNALRNDVEVCGHSMCVEDRHRVLDEI